MVKDQCVFVTGPNSKTAQKSEAWYILVYRGHTSLIMA